MAKRLLTALVGIIVGVSIIIFDNIWLYTVAVAFFSGLGTYELIRSVKCDHHKLLTFFCLVFSAGAPFVLIFRQDHLLLPLFGGFIMLLFSVMLSKHKEMKFEHIAMSGAAATLIPAALSCIVLFRYTAPADNQAMGIFMIIYLLFCAWFGDSGAYFVGTFLGKHKLCPNVSPKKTVEGLIGGIITVGIVVFIEGLVFNMFFFDAVQVNYVAVVIVGMIASGFGVLGDLSASVIKREFGVKDFGTLFPGHGGVLDRFDSVLFVAPFIYIIYQYFSPFTV